MSSNRLDNEKLNLDLTIKNKFISENTAFLIEGAETDGRNNSAQEISAAINLAKENNCEIFDVVSSYQYGHLEKAFKNADELKQKLIVRHVLLLFKKHYNPLQWIIDNVIKIPYQNLINLGIFKEMPEWLKLLNDSTIDNLQQEITDAICQKFLQSNEDINKFIEEINNELDELEKELINISNKISCSNLIKYLIASPKIDVIYGLVGYGHLPMVEMIGDVLERKDEGDSGEVHGIVWVDNNRTVELHLFGGSHREMKHYQKFSDYVAKQGLKLPKSLFGSFEKAEIETVISVSTLKQLSFFRRVNFLSQDEMIDIAKNLNEISEKEDRYTPY